MTFIINKWLISKITLINNASHNTITQSIYYKINLFIYQTRQLIIVSTKIYLKQTKNYNINNLLVFCVYFFFLFPTLKFGIIKFYYITDKRIRHSTISKKVLQNVVFFFKCAHLIWIIYCKNFRLETFYLHSFYSNIKFWPSNKKCMFLGVTIVTLLITFAII